MAIAKLSSTKFKVNLGFLAVETNWEIDEIQKKAAWEMYVELATRITTAELQKGEGLLREALNSLYSIFATTRGILKNTWTFDCHTSKSKRYDLWTFGSWHIK